MFECGLIVCRVVVRTVNGNITGKLPSGLPPQSSSYSLSTVGKAATASAKQQKAKQSKKKSSSTPTGKLPTAKLQKSTPGTAPVIVPLAPTPGALEPAFLIEHYKRSVQRTERLRFNFLSGMLCAGDKRREVRG